MGQCVTRAKANVNACPLLVSPSAQTAEAWECGAESDANKSQASSPPCECNVPAETEPRPQHVHIRT